MFEERYISKFVREDRVKSTWHVGAEFFYLSLSQSFTQHGIEK